MQKRRRVDATPLCDDAGHNAALAQSWGKVPRGLLQCSRDGSCVWLQRRKELARCEIVQCREEQMSTRERPGEIEKKRRPRRARDQALNTRRSFLSPFLFSKTNRFCFHQILESSSILEAAVMAKERRAFRRKIQHDAGPSRTISRSQAFSRGSSGSLKYKSSIIAELL